MSAAPLPVPSRPRLTSVEAQLYVADVARSCDFFSRQLGFAVSFTYGDPPFYGVVQRDQAKIAMRCVDKPVFAGDIREREQLLSASVTLDTAAEINQLFSDFRSTGVEFQQTLTRQAWGALNFVVRDPDGNLILFAGPAQ